MNTTDLVEISQDIKIITDTLRSALQYFIPQQGVNGSRVLLRQATKAGKKLSLGSHHGNVSHMLKMSGSYCF